MKKTLLLLGAALLSLGMQAQDVTLDFTTNTWNLPEGSSNKATAEAQFTDGTYTITLTGSSDAGYYFNAQGYLMLGKSGATLTLPAFTSDVATIEVVGREGASASTQQNIYVGDTEVSTATKGATGTNTYAIADDYQKAGTQYTLKVTSKHNTQITKINIYYKAASTLKAAGLQFSEGAISIEEGTEFTAPTFTKETTAPVTFASDNAEVATVDAEGVIALAGGIGKATITATSEANEEYAAGEATCTVEVFKYNYYTKATTVESGKSYLIVAQRNDSTFYAYPLSSTKTYGYLSVGKIGSLIDTIRIKSSYDDSFVFLSMDGGYSIEDADGRYYIQKGTYKSFNIVDEPAAWTVDAQEDGTFKIAMNGYYMQFGQGTYTSFGVYTEDQENAVLPFLYVYNSDITSGISNTVVEKTVNENAPLYNLAGQRVSPSYKGVVIQNGKKFIQK